MKLHIITVLLALAICHISSAQLKETVLKTVHDDGKIMQLKIQVSLHDASIHYDEKIDVSKMTKDEKNSLINYIIDSLGARKYFSAEAASGEKKKSERELVTAAVKDYVDALYEADTSKIERSVAKHLAKRGYYTSDGVAREGTMTYDQLINLTKRWKATKDINENTPKKIVVFDVLDKTASAKLEAHWGIDYFHLAKVDGKWMIVNVLWQEYPKN